MRSVILIDDSIRMHYTPFVQQALHNEVTVWGPETNCRHSRNILAHLDEWMNHPADTVHLNCGLHDLTRDPDKARTINGCRVPLDEYRENVRAILEHLLYSGRTVVWATITPVNEANHRSHFLYHRRETDVDAYNAATREIAENLGVPINDLFQVITEAGPDKLLSPDGVHFNEEGRQLLGRAVVNKLRSLW